MARQNSMMKVQMDSHSWLQISDHVCNIFQTAFFLHCWVKSLPISLESKCSADHRGNMFSQSDNVLKIVLAIRFSPSKNMHIVCVCKAWSNEMKWNIKHDLYDSCVVFWLFHVYLKMPCSLALCRPLSVAHPKVVWSRFDSSAIITHSQTFKNWQMMVHIAGCKQSCWCNGRFAQELQHTERQNGKWSLDKFVYSKVSYLFASKVMNKPKHFNSLHVRDLRSLV